MHLPRNHSLPSVSHDHANRHGNLLDHVRQRQAIGGLMAQGFAAGRVTPGKIAMGAPRPCSIPSETVAGHVFGSMPRPAPVRRGRQFRTGKERTEITSIETEQKLGA